MACNKTSFATKKEAKKKLREIHRYGNVRDKTPVRAYICVCGNYHLTSREKE